MRLQILYKHTRSHGTTYTMERWTRSTLNTLNNNTLFNCKWTSVKRCYNSYVFIIENGWYGIQQRWLLRYYQYIPSDVKRRHLQNVWVFSRFEFWNAGIIRLWVEPITHQKYNTHTVYTSSHYAIPIINKIDWPYANNL